MNVDNFHKRAQNERYYLFDNFTIKIAAAYRWKDTSNTFAIIFSTTNYRAVRSKLRSLHSSKAVLKRKNNSEVLLPVLLM